MNPRRPLPLVLLAAVVACAAATSVNGLPAQKRGRDRDQSWPHWMGPDRTNVSTETGWSVDGKNLWQADVGLGYSNVAIADGLLYTIGHDAEAEKDTVWCLDAETGKERWSHSYEMPLMAKAHGGGSLTTPTVHDGKVYVLTRLGRLFCFQAKSGKVLWERDLAEEYGAEVPTWGFATSPMVLDDRELVIHLGRVLVFDLKSNKLKWKSEDLGHAYATPALTEVGGKPAFAVFAGKGLALLDRKSGRTMSDFEWKTSYDVNAATPVLVDGDRIFISSGYDTGAAMVEVTRGRQLKELWRNKVMRNHMSGSVLHDGHLYGIDDTRGLKCIDLRGEEKWTARTGKGAVSLADGKLLVLTARGQLVIAEATPDEYKVLSEADALDGGRCWTTPVLCNGLIYCRNSQGQLVCRDHRGE